MSSELTVLNSSAIQAGGLGMNRDNRLFELKPANLTIVDTFDTAANIIAGFGIAGSAPVGTAIEFTYNNASNASITLAIREN